MSVDDPTATYRGYRRQALYSLFRLFDDALPEGIVIQPEGNEDLAIFDSAGALVEIVQVKDYSHNLAASSFKSSFYERIAPYCATDSSTKVRIASYGPIGPDLRDAVSGDAAAKSRVLKTITKSRTREYKLANGTKQTYTIPGLTDTEAENIINHLVLSSVAEEELTNSVISALSKTITGVDAHNAFDFLMWWLLTSSETQLRIDRSEAIIKVEHIGRFLSQRAAYHDEWYTSIIPIGPTGTAAANVTSLAEEFYRGGRVRFDHVNLDFDVPRDRILSEIHAAFNSHDIVIVHSPSGQGKTTLAYRYAKNFAPSAFRFEILTSLNLKHARRLALALIGHAEAVEVPTLIFLDVRPGDNYWTEVVRELSSVIGIRIIVTIREEDWVRARISAADFSFYEVQLAFEVEEAELIYNRLRAQVKQSRHLDFEDAWNQFGTRKTLFEFAYYITQEVSLAERITAQINALQDAVIRGERSEGELDLLRLVAVATSYEARLNLAKLLNYCDLSAPQRTIDLFNEEYFIRVSADGQHIEGFHSIRSEIISNVLTDPVVSPWSEAASRTLPLIVEEDLQDFLLCAFSRNSDATHSLISALDDFRPRTWVGIHGVTTSLMWNGIKQYTEENSALLEEVYQKLGDGWYGMLDWDLGQALGKKGFQLFESLENMSKEAAKAASYARSVKSRQSDKDRVFSEMRHWLEKYSESPLFPDDIQSFNTMGEIAFWIGHLQIDTTLRKEMTGDSIDKALEELPVYLLGEFVRGIRTCVPSSYEEWVRTHWDNLVKYLRHEAAIIVWDETDDALIAHYAINLDRQSSALRSRGKSSVIAETTIHDLTIERIELLSNLFPGKKRYGAVGYGHRISLVSQFWDEADKPGVLAENLHAIWPPRFNALARGYTELKFRPVNWSDYFRLLQSLREEVLAAFDDLRQSIPRLKDPPVRGMRFLQNTAEWDNCRRKINMQLLLPKAALDEWGFITESSISNDTDPRSERYSGLRRFTPVRKAVGEYTRTIGNFMSQALDCLVLVPHLRNAKSQLDKDNLLATVSALGIKESSIRLSIINGMDACAAVEQIQRTTNKFFEYEQPLGADVEFCEREHRESFLTITTWCMFVDDFTGKEMAKKSNKKPPSHKRKTIKAAGIGDLLLQTRNRLKNSLQALRKKGIKAQILTENEPWNDCPALWITCDTIHPIGTLNSIEIMWHQLIAAFEPDREKIVKVKAIELLWSSIVLVPLVCGKSLERQAIPHFKGVTYMEPPDLVESMWHLFPENIPEDVWPQLALDHWDAHPNWAVFDRFAAAYGLLFHHVDHMADFDRLPGDLDELGRSILQFYINHEITRAEPLLQEVLDTYTGVLRMLPENDDEVLECRPNIYFCTTSLVQMKDAIMPTPDFNKKAILSIEQVVNWRDRLFAGLQQLGSARYLWIADSLNLNECPDLT